MRLESEKFDKHKILNFISIEWVGETNVLMKMSDKNMSKDKY